MKKLAVALVLLLLIPSTAAALTTEELVALVAMPVAVAAVSEMAGVPTHDLIQVVSAMNRAAVPPPQFIEVVRYVPVALVEPAEPTFVTYVTREVDRGIHGQQLAVSMANQLDTYGVREINVVSPPVRYVRQDYIPPMVVTRVEQRRVDPLSLVAMPLAVAAVAELAGVPRNDLFDLVRSLNRAAVPAPQFIEIVRYSPVVLVDRQLQPELITFVDRSVDRGLTGIPLALAIDSRFRSWGVEEIRVMQPVEPVRVVRREFIPTTVVTRVAQVSGHPHGGPPGQLKRDLGVQTGAEVVHGTHPGRAAARPAAQAPSRAVEVRDRPARASGESRAPAAKSKKQQPSEVREVRSEPRREPPRANQGNRGKGNAGVKPQRVTAEPAQPQPQAARPAVSEQPGRGQGQAKGGGGQGGQGSSGNRGKGKGKGGE
jgi:hypothetical protein